jgi:hypothetical protein
MFSGTAQVSLQVCQFFFGQLCVSSCASDWWIKTRLLLFANHVGNNAIRKEEREA